MIYELVLGGRVLHVSEHYDKRTHGYQWSNEMCYAEISEAEAQKRFQETETLAWYVEASVSRHGYCMVREWLEEPLGQGQSNNLLLSCQQVYNEAKFLPYSTNTFLFDDPLLLQRFLRRLLDEGFAAAIRKVLMEISFPKEDYVRHWHRAIAMMAEHLSGLQTINLSMDQGCPVRRYGPYRTALDFAEADEDWWTSTLDSLDQLRVLPLKTATFVISDEGLPCRWLDWHSPRDYWFREQKYRWTLEEKRKWAKGVTETILGRKEKEKKRVLRQAANQDASFERLPSSFRICYCRSAAVLSARYLFYRNRRCGR